MFKCENCGYDIVNMTVSIETCPRCLHKINQSPKQDNVRPVRTCGNCKYLINISNSSNSCPICLHQLDELPKETTERGYYTYTDGSLYSHYTHYDGSTSSNRILTNEEQQRSAKQESKEKDRIIFKLEEKYEKLKGRIWQIVILIVCLVAMWFGFGGEPGPWEGLE